MQAPGSHADAQVASLCMAYEPSFVAVENMSDAYTKLPIAYNHQEPCQ